MAATEGRAVAPRAEADRRVVAGWEGVERVVPVARAAAVGAAAASAARAVMAAARVCPVVTAVVSTACS